MLEFVTFVLLLPLPIVVWWLDRQREEKFRRLSLAERMRSERLASALQSVLSNAPDRGTALDTLWEYYRSPFVSSSPDEFDEWLAHGVSRGWVSKPVCAMHDGLPTTEDEEAELDEGYDPCMAALRLWGADGRP